MKNLSGVRDLEGAFKGNTSPIHGSYMCPTHFIAEVSSNHHRDLDRCLRFIEAAAAVGCDSVKFQLFKIDDLFAQEILANSEKHRRRRDWELPVEFLPRLKQHCAACNILFGCTPFYLEAVQELLPYVDYFKIGSYELLWNELLQACGETGLPVVLSTGMATIEEIDNAVQVLQRSGCSDLTLLHCVSAYPTPENECNLAVLGTYRKRYRVKVGWSDHSVSTAVISRAVHRWEADCVEFHFDLDKAGEEYGAGHCWLPEQIAPVIRASRNGDMIDGSPEKQLAPSEAIDREWRADPTDGLRPLLPLRKSYPFHVEDGEGDKS